MVKVSGISTVWPTRAVSVPSCIVGAAAAVPHAINTKHSQISGMEIGFLLLFILVFPTEKPILFLVKQTFVLILSSAWKVRLSIG
jgi:hypothetical protein